MQVEVGIQLGDLKGIVRRRFKVVCGVALAVSLTAYWVAMALPKIRVFFFLTQNGPPQIRVFFLWVERPSLMGKLVMTFGNPLVTLSKNFMSNRRKTRFSGSV